MLGLLLTVVVTLLIIGVLLWAIGAMPWIDPDIKQAIKIIVVVIVAFWLIATLFGVLPQPSFRFPR